MLTEEHQINFVILALKNTAPEALRDVPTNGEVNDLCPLAVETFWDRVSQRLVGADAINILICALACTGFGDHLVPDGIAGPGLKRSLNIFLATGGYVPR